MSDSVIASTTWMLLQRFGALGFIAIGIIDSSLIPTFGSMDVFLVIMCAAHHQWWWYYALFATIGSFIGGYLTYRISAKGGKEMLEKKLGKPRAEKAYSIFDRMGFWSIFIGTIAPPPFPSAPVLATAGALQYSRRNFLLAVASGRVLRYGLIGWFSSSYGRQILGFFARYQRPALWVLIGLGVAAGIFGLVYWIRKRRQRRPAHSTTADGKAA